MEDKTNNEQLNHDFLSIAGDDFIRAVRALCEKKVFNKNGFVRGLQRTWGYVCNIHDDEEDEYYGTVDVQEWYADEGELIHEHVLVSTLKDDKTGVRFMPCLYSDVLIAFDPSTHEEYISMFSHVDLIQMRSHKTAMVGVVETEAFEEGDNGPDVPDLTETGNSAKTTYEKDKISAVVESDNKEACSITLNADGSITIKGGDIKIKGDSVKVESDVIKHNDGGQKMVLGDKLIGHLQNLCTALATMTVTTHVGTAPVTNPVVFTNLASQFSSDLSQKSSLD